MVNTQFEEYKIRRELRRNGVAVVFYRPGVNPFGERLGYPKQVPPPPGTAPRVGEHERGGPVGMLTGLFHSTNDQSRYNETGSNEERNLSTSALLCLYEDAKGLELLNGDYCFINKSKFTVKGVVNLQELNIFADVLLEKQDTGGTEEVEYGH